MKIQSIPIEALNRILIESLYEILGPGQLQEVATRANLPVLLQNGSVELLQVLELDHWQGLLDQLVERFGQEGAMGIAIRTGQGFFSGYLRMFGLESPLNDPDFRMLPKPRRILNGLHLLADLHEQVFPPISVHVSQEETCWQWLTIDPQKSLKNGKMSPFLQSFTCGVIQEFLSWTSGGKVYPVQRILDSENGAGGMSIQIKTKYLS